MNGEMILRVATKVASRWVAHRHLRDDLRSEAAFQMTKALPAFKPERGTIDNYLERVGHLAIHRYVAKNSAPVSFPRLAPLEAQRFTELPPEASPEDPPDVQAAKNRFREDVRERLLYLVGAEGSQLLLQGDQTDEEYLTWRRARYRVLKDRKMQALWKEVTE